MGSLENELNIATNITMSFERIVAIFIIISLAVLSKALPRPQPETNCESFATFGDPISVNEDASNRNCTDFEQDGYRCVPFYGCKGGQIITSGYGIADIRRRSSALLDSKCSEILEICCRHPDWRDVPLETYVEIENPPAVCEEDFYNNDNYEYEDSTCIKDGVTYEDLDEIPNSESCNKCTCDFGEIICTEEVCDNQTEEYISNTDFDELIEYEYESIPDVTTSSIPSSTSMQGMNKVGDELNEIVDTIPGKTSDPSNLDDVLRNVRRYTVIETKNCDSFGGPKNVFYVSKNLARDTIFTNQHIAATVECEDFSKNGYRCVPEYACKDGDVIVNTPKPIHSQLSRMMLLFYNEYSKCPGQDEICCQHQDWKNVPLESSVVVKKPSIDCRASSIKSVNIKG